MGDDQLYADRVARLDDPAQVDPQERARSIDGFVAGQPHYCAQESTRIHDPAAFVAAFAGAVKHPRVRAALDTPWLDGVPPPRGLRVLIAELLGPQGHEACSGFRLVGEGVESKKARKEWVKARAEGRDLTGIPAPQAERIPTFEGGNIVINFRANPAAARYEVVTRFPSPPDTDLKKG
ncbi:hypothetical protein ACFV9C_06920 [Kribbella sp. NPDC059898]|uniref:hypothetical protein n=1 Tax=Kribbella sp. NPDC059898 TaxID=3346995 RepID=UPI003667D80E